MMKSGKYETGKSFVDIVTRKLINEATEKEVKELEDLLNKNPDLSYAIEIISCWWVNGERQNEETRESKEAFAKTSLSNRTAADHS